MSASRASVEAGAPVIANALALTAKAAAGKLPALVAAELGAARKAGFDAALEDLKPKSGAPAETIAMPAAVPVDAQIAGVDVMEMDNATRALWKEGIYAESAMGCTGPVIRVQSAVCEKAGTILKQAGFI